MSATATEPRTACEEHKVTGEKLAARVRELLHEGNARRIIVKNEAGRTLVDIPLTFGVVGAALTPMLAAIGGLAALAKHFSIVVVRDETAPEEQAAGSAP